MMKPETKNVLLKAYAQLHQITEELYSASDKAVENNDFEDASTARRKSKVKSQKSK
ncbi:hypothetical protein [Nostoc sp.]|uniref:hypothetical protein n=1 Tax=Nostoc sp. TaxID=1180 RepID=UPI002FFA71C8